MAKIWKISIFLLDFGNGTKIWTQIKRWKITGLYSEILKTIGGYHYSFQSLYNRSIADHLLGANLIVYIGNASHTRTGTIQHQFKPIFYLFTIFPWSLLNKFY